MYVVLFHGIIIIELLSFVPMSYATVKPLAVSRQRPERAPRRATAVLATTYLAECHSLHSTATRHGLASIPRNFQRFSTDLDWTVGEMRGEDCQLEN